MNCRIDGDIVQDGQVTTAVIYDSNLNPNKRTTYA